MDGTGPANRPAGTPAARLGFRAGPRASCAAVLGSLAALSLAATLPLSLLSGQLGDGIVALVIGVPCAGVGFIVARRQPHNPLGWLFLAAAILLFVANDGGDYAYAVYRLGRRLPLGPVGLAVDELWVPGLVLFVVVIVLFPDGRLSSGLWRSALRLYCTLYIVLLAAYTVATARALSVRPLRIDAVGGLSTVDNPAGAFGALFHAILILMLALSVGFIIRQVLSWRTSSGDRREQLKWLASGAAIAIASSIPGAAFGTTGHTTTALAWIDNLLWLGLAALPVSMGVAILKYRLYDIDRIISRTLAYAIVTGLLVGLYAGLVLLATHVLSFHTPVAVAASTLAAAALFNPLRRRVQHVVDRRFNRSRYDADQTIAAFAARLKDAVDLNSVREDLAAVVDQALEPAHVSLWINERG